MAIARRLGPQGRLPTVRQLRDSLGASLSTLHEVLGRLEQEGIIIREQGRGIFVAPTAHQSHIGVVTGSDLFESSFSPFWFLLLQQARAQLARRQYRFSCYLDLPAQHGDLANHEQLVQDLRARKLHGLFLLLPHGADEIEWLKSWQVPLVAFGGDQTADYRVRHDGERAIELAVDELARQGMRTIGLIGAFDDSERATFRAQLSMRRLTEDPRWEWSYAEFAPRIQHRTREEFAAGVVHHQLTAGNLPEGLIITDDTMARGAVVALHRAGLPAERRPRIVAFGNKDSPVLTIFADELMVVEYDPADTVRAVLDTLEILIAGGRPPRTEILIAPRLRPQPMAAPLTA